MTLELPLKGMVIGARWSAFDDWVAWKIESRALLRDVEIVGQALPMHEVRLWVYKERGGRSLQKFIGRPNDVAAFRLALKRGQVEVRRG